MKSEIVWDSVDHITHEAVAQSATSIIEPGAVLMVVRSGILARTVPIALAGRSLALNQDLKALCPGPSIDSKFLYYLLESKMPELLSLVSRGATVHRLITDQIRDIEFRLPPLIEQRRIVGILDEAFEGIATAKAHAERNLRSAREVRDTFLAAQFSPAPHWISGPLSAFVESVSTGPFGSVLHKSDYVANGVPLVNPINIVDGDIVPTDEKQVDAATALRLRSYLLRSGDIVVGRRGEIGRCAVVSDVQEGWLCGTGCFFIRPSSRVQPSFMAHLIRSARYRARLEALSTGTTMQNLSNGALSGLEVVLPDLAEQKRLLAEIDAMSAQTDLLREVYERKLAALDELQQSLLHQAFSGAL
jgi:type I restriction enzyme S subunit